MSQLSFGNIILAQNGKKGVLKPDDEGYYYLNAGGFNIPNRHGLTYTANRYIQECMHPESDLNRRVSRGEVYAECGHPPMFFFERIDGRIVRTKITDLLQWINRLKMIDMERVCGHIREIVFDTSGWTPSNNAPIYNYIWIKPYLSTVFGQMFKENLDTPSMNTSMSIRTVTTPLKFGDTTREAEYFTNYDWVPEPGMDWANKHQTAGCEAFHVELGFDENSVMTINEDRAIQIIEDGLTNITDVQSKAGMEALDNIQTILNVLKTGKHNRTGEREFTFSRSALGLF